MDAYWMYSEKGGQSKAVDASKMYIKGGDNEGGKDGGKEGENEKG